MPSNFLASAFEDIDHKFKSNTADSPKIPTLGHDPYSAFRFRSYRNYAIGNLGSALGRQMLSVAVEWEIYQRTHSAAALGFTGLALALPTIIFALPAGHLADCVSRKHILLVTQCLTAIFSLALASFSFLQADVHWFYAVLFASGTARAFGWATRSALVVNLVPSSQLTNAVTWDCSLLQIASVIGPAAAGLFLSRFSACAIYAINAVTSLLFVALFWRTVIPQPSAMQSKAAPAGLKELLSGFLFVWKTKIVLAAITLDLFAVLLGGATVLLPVYADSLLHTGALGLGWMRAAPAIGAVAMSLALAHSPPMRCPGRTLLWGVVGFGLATIAFGVSRSLGLSLFALTLVGAFDNISVIVRRTLVQTLTPDAMRGRVSAVNNVFSGSSNQLGAFESGMTAAWLGPTASVVGGGFATILVVLAVVALWPEVVGLESISNLETSKLMENECSDMQEV